MSCTSLLGVVVLQLHRPGDVYEGHWKDNQCHGAGVHTRTSTEGVCTAHSIAKYKSCGYAWDVMAELYLAYRYVGIVVIAGPVGRVLC